MSNPIDETIARLSLDNKDFEKNAKQSLDTIQNVNNAMKKGDGDLGYMTEAIGRVSNRFTLLGNITQEVFQRISKKVVDTAEKMMKAMTIESPKDGFNKYELKMGAIQTIMASTGESLEVVTKKLKELNDYSDKTIYSFSDMTANIGKFTNSGVKLEDAVTAMIGISNEAAISGAGTAEAARAMYNLAQSLSMGYIQYIDWKSIENANMATKSFKEELAKTAIEVGTITKSTDGYTTAAGKSYKLQQLFKDGLKDQWLNSEVLIKTLSKYADETTEIGKKAGAAATEVKTWTQMISVMKEALSTGWTRTWEIVVGNFDEAKKMFTNINNVVGGFLAKQAEARNAILQEWKDLGGRQAMINGFVNIFKTFGNILSPITKLVSTLVSKITGNNLADFSKSFESFTKILVDKTQFLRDIDIASLVEDVIEKINLTIDKAKGLKERLQTSLKTIYETWLKWTGKIKDDYERQLKGKIMAGGGIATAALALIKFAFMLKDAITKVKGTSETVVDALKEDKMVGAIRMFISGFKTLTDAIILPSLKVASLAALIWSLSQLVAALGKVKDMDMEHAKAVVFVLTILLAEMAVMFLLAARLNKDIIKIDKDDSGNTVMQFNIIEHLLKIGDHMAQIAKLGKTFASFGGAVKDLANAVKTLGQLEPKELEQGLKAMTVLLITLPIVFRIFDLFGKKVDPTVGVFLIAFAIIIKKVGDVLIQLKDLQPESALTSAIFMGLVMLEMTMILKIMENTEPNGKGVAGILAISVAMDALVIALKVMSTINTENLMASVLALGFILTELSIALKVLDDIPEPGGVIAAAASMVIIAFAIDMISVALVGLSFIQTEKLAKSVAAVALIAAGLTKVVHSLASIKKKQVAGVLAGGAAIVLLAVAIDMIAVALLGLTLTSPEKLALSVVVVAAVIEVLVSATKALTKIKMGQIAGLVAGTASILGMVTALDIISVALGALSVIKPERLYSSVGAVVIVIGMLAIAANSLTNTKGFVGAASMVLMAIAVTTIALALIPLTLVNTDKLIVATVAVGVIMVILGEIASHMKSVGNLIGGGVMIMLSVSIMMLVGALLILQGINADVLMVGVMAIAALLFELGIALQFMQAGLIGAAALIVAAASLMILGQALQYFAGGSSVIQAGQALCIFLTDLSLGLLMMTLGIVGALSLAMVGSALVSLAKALDILGGSNFYIVVDYIKPLLQNLGEGLAAMDGCIMGSISLRLAAPSLPVLAKALKSFKGLKIDSLGKKIYDLLRSISKGILLMTFGVGGAITLAAVAGALYGLALAVKQLKDLKFKTLNPQIQGLFKVVSDGTKSLKGVTKGATNLGKIAPALQKVAKAAKSLDGLKSMENVGKNLKAIFDNVADVTKNVNDSGKGAEAIATIGPSLKDIFTGIKQLNGVKIEDNFGDALKKIFSSINSAVQEFSTLDGTNYIGIDVLSKIGEPLKLFGEGILTLSQFSSHNDPGDILRKTLGPLSDYLPKLNVDQSAVTTFAGVAGSLEQFAKGVGEMNKVASHNDPGDSIRRTLGALIDYLPKLAGQESGVQVFGTVSGSLAGFAKGIGALNKQSSHSDPGEVIRKTLGAMVDYLPMLNGAESGAKSFVILSDKLEVFAKGIEALNKFSTHNDPGDILRKTLSPLAEYIAKFQNMKGAANAIGVVAEKLETLATGMTALIKVPNTSDPGDNIRKLLGAISDYLPQIGGVKDFTLLAEKLETLAAGLTALVTIPTVSDPGDVIRKTFGALSDYSGTITYSASLLNVCDALPKLAEGIGALGSISGYNDPGDVIRKTLGAVTDYLPKLSANSLAMGSFTSTVRELVNLSGFITKISSTDANTLQTNLYALAAGISALCGVLSGRVSGLMSETTVALNTFYEAVEKITNVSPTWSDDVIKGLTNISSTKITQAFKDGMAEDFSQALATIVKSVDDTIPELMNRGVSLSKGLADGIHKSTAYIRNELRIMGSQVRDQATTSGKWFGQGFVNGINSQLTAIANAGTNAGKTAYNALKNAIQQGSPSKLTTESGEFFGEGFYNGVLSLYYKIREGVAGMGALAVNTLNDSISGETKFTPVMDMDALNQYSWMQGGIDINSKGIKQLQRQYNPMLTAMEEMQAKMEDAYTKLNNTFNEMKDSLDVYANRPQPEFVMNVNGRRFASATAQDFNVELGKIRRNKR